MRPEAAELLRCVFYGHEVRWPAELTADAFFQEVAVQGMAPLLFRNISKHDCWPAELTAKLKGAALHQAAAELRVEADLRALLHAFAEAGIQLLLLKGTALAYSLYPEPWLRPRCDTDLLVAATERKKTAAVLQQLGYAPLLEAESEYLGSQKSYSKTGPGSRFTCDLHWQISNTNRQFSQNFTEGGLQAIAIPALGEHARTLNKIDSLLYACFHRAGHFSHSGDRLIWLHDIHLLSQSLTDEETETFCVKARRLEISTLCADALAVAQSWFNTKLPAPLEVLMQEEQNGQEEALAALLKPGGRQVGIKHHALLELQGLPTWRERISFLWQNAFPPPEFMLWRYSASKNSALPLLYLKRFAEAVFIFLKR
ncbi:MAG: nucleotidyltransferase domain-containing protein [Candidatus Electronema sp. VV]